MVQYIAEDEVLLERRLGSGRSKLSQEQSDQCAARGYAAYKATRQAA
jgi:hypothetical protein